MSCDLEELGVEQHSAVTSRRQRDDRLDVVTRVDIIEDGEGDGGGLELVGQVARVDGRVGGRARGRDGVTEQNTYNKSIYFPYPTR